MPSTSNMYRLHVHASDRLPVCAVRVRRCRMRHAVDSCTTTPVPLGCTLPAMCIHPSMPLTAARQRPFAATSPMAQLDARTHAPWALTGQAAGQGKKKNDACRGVAALHLSHRGEALSLTHSVPNVCLSLTHTLTHSHAHPHALTHFTLTHTRILCSRPQPAAHHHRLSHIIVTGPAICTVRAHARTHVALTSQPSPAQPRPLLGPPRCLIGCKHLSYDQPAAFVSSSRPRCRRVPASALALSFSHTHTLPLSLSHTRTHTRPHTRCSTNTAHPCSMSCHAMQLVENAAQSLVDPLAT